MKPQSYLTNTKAGKSHLIFPMSGVNVVLTLFWNSLRLWTLDALVLCPSVTGRVHCDARVWVALEGHHIVLARHLTAELVWNTRCSLIIHKSRARTCTASPNVTALLSSTFSTSTLKSEEVRSHKTLLGYTVS